MKYALATNWDDNLLIHLKKLNKNKKDKIIELFGALAYSVLGSARSVPRVKDISIKDAEKKIRKIKDAGFQFNYLLNSSVFPNLKSKEKLEEAKKYLFWLRDLKPDIITIGNEKAIELVSRYLPNIPLNLSITMAIKDVNKAERLFKKYPNIKRITPHQIINRDLKKLKDFIKIAHKYKVKVELLANEICLYDCPRMKEHYAYLGEISRIGIKTHEEFETWCDKIKVENPIEFLNSCWIRPEDVKIYENLEVDIVKIAGRGEDSRYLKKVSKTYMERKHKGNVMSLFYPNFWPQNKIPFIESSKLNGFIEYLWNKKLKKLTIMSKKYNIMYKFKEN